MYITVAYIHINVYIYTYIYYQLSSTYRRGLVRQSSDPPIKSSRATTYRQNGVRHLYLLYIYVYIHIYNTIHIICRFIHAYIYYQHSSTYRRGLVRQSSEPPIKSSRATTFRQDGVRSYEPLDLERRERESERERASKRER